VNFSTRALQIMVGCDFSQTRSCAVNSHTRIVSSVVTVNCCLFS